MENYQQAALQVIEVQVCVVLTAFAKCMSTLVGVFACMAHGLSAFVVQAASVGGSVAGRPDAAGRECLHCQAADHDAGGARAVPLSAAHSVRQVARAGHRPARQCRWQQCGCSAMGHLPPLAARSGSLQTIPAVKTRGSDQ